MECEHGIPDSQDCVLCLRQDFDLMDKQWAEQSDELDEMYSVIQQLEDLIRSADPLYWVVHAEYDAAYEWEKKVEKLGIITTRKEKGTTDEEETNRTTDR